MENIYPHLREDYKRIYKTVDDSQFKSLDIICYDDVLKAHYLLVDYFHQEGEQLVYGVKDLNILGSALGRQIVGFGSNNKWQKKEELCATLFYGLIKNYAFHDGNKRTALLILLFQLQKYGKTITIPQKELELLAVRVAASDLKSYTKFSKYVDEDDAEVKFLADFIRNSTRNIDRTTYLVTYQELNTLLRKYDYFLEDASGNYINVMKSIPAKLFTKGKKVKVLQIGFGGWKRQVHPKALKEVLKATKLTAQNGFDSQVFFKGADPLPALIDIYSGPLRRLKDK